MDFLNLIDFFKPKSKRGNRKKNKKKEEKDEEIVGAIVEPLPNIPTTDELDPAENEVPDNDNEESIGNDLDTSSEGDELSEEDNTESDMGRVLALINSGLNEDKTKIDPKAEEAKYCDKCDEALNKNKTVGCVVVGHLCLSYHCRLSNSYLESSVSFLTQL